MIKHYLLTFAAALFCTSAFAASELSAEEKERRIDAYYEGKNRALAQAYTQIDQALDSVEQGMTR